MHTLLLTDAFLPHAGGSRVYYFNLYRRLAEEHGERVTVLTRKSPGWEEFDRNMPRGLEIRRCGHRANHVKAREWPKLLPYFGRTLQAWGFGRNDVLHTGDLFPAGVSAGLLSRLARMPYLAFCHCEEIPNTEPYRLQRRVRDWIYQNAAVMVAACNFTKQNLIRTGVDGSRIRVLTPGVDSERFRPEQKDPELLSRYGLQGKLVLLTVARLVRRKGQHLVIEALARLRPEGVRYIVAGTGPEEQRLKALTAEAGLQETVIFTGYVQDQELLKLYHLCDLFVMPNHQPSNGDLEGFGMVFAEASAAGKPVIAGRSGGTSDAVQDGVTGFLVDSQAPDELLARMRQLLVDRELRRKMGEAGRHRMCTEFNWQTRAAELHEINLRLASGGRRPAAVPKNGDFAAMSKL